MPDEIVEFGTGFASRGNWDDVVMASSEGWFWATRASHEFRIACVKAGGHLFEDRSFGLLRDGKMIGLAPLVILLDKDLDEKIGSYVGAPLPWPMTVPGLADEATVQNAVFDEAEARARRAGAAALRLMLAPPGLGDDLDDRFLRIVRQRGYVDTSHASHWVEVGPTTLCNVRERYRRNVRKYMNRYEIEILSSREISSELAAYYMSLHMKDAGRLTRPLETYERQMDLVKHGEGFWVAAKNIAANRVVGMLLVSVYKGGAYDNSVAVDPDFQNEPVSHLMKWRAIEYLLSLGITHYELGHASLAPTYLDQPADKNYGISFFKDGWARGKLKTVRSADKFFSRRAFDMFWNQKRDALYSYFSI